MSAFKYLIVGGGMTADAAVRGVRELDPDGPIEVLSAEPCEPYDRPPLSKGLWKGADLESIWRNTKSVPGVSIHIQTRAVEINAARKSVLDEQGRAFSYDKLLLATGGTPRRLKIADAPVIYFRTLSDFHELRALARTGNRFAVVGGGFIGSELAAALGMIGKQVVMIFPEQSVCTRVFPPDLAAFVTGVYEQRGVQIVRKSTVERIAVKGKQVNLQTSTGTGAISVDGIVAGLGIIPDVQLALGLGLEVSDGIVVDEFLRTSAPDIYAAGDVARFYNPSLNMTLRVEHEDNANVMGRIAGRNMAGATDRYDHLPSFYSDLFEFGYEAVGELDARLETVPVWSRQFREGIIYYLREDRVRGVLLWNVWNQVDAARTAIGSGKVVTSADLETLIPMRRS